MAKNVIKENGEKKVKFTEVKVENIEGKIETIDISRELGNALYTQGQDVAICECGKKIYYGEAVELTQLQKDFIKKIIAQYPYIYRNAIECLIE